MKIHLFSEFMLYQGSVSLIFFSICRLLFAVALDPVWTSSSYQSARNKNSSSSLRSQAFRRNAHQFLPTLRHRLGDFELMLLCWMRWSSLSGSCHPTRRGSSKSISNWHEMRGRVAISWCPKGFQQHQPRNVSRCEASDITAKMSITVLQGTRSSDLLQRSSLVRVFLRTHGESEDASDEQSSGQRTASR